MNNFKLEDGRILIWQNSHYQEYKEPVKPRMLDRWANTIHNQQDYLISKNEYQTQLSHYLEVKRLLEVEKPKYTDPVYHEGQFHYKEIYEEHLEDYNQAQTRLEELYKEHNK